MPRPYDLKKKGDTLRFFGKDVDKVHLYFAAQRAAFMLMVIGFLVFVLIWYLQNR